MKILNALKNLSAFLYSGDDDSYCLSKQFIYLLLVELNPLSISRSKKVAILMNLHEKLYLERILLAMFLLLKGFTRNLHN